VTNWGPLVLVPARNVREVFGSIRNKGCSNLGMRPQCSRVSARKTFFNSTLWELCSATKSSIILCDSAGVCDTGGGTSTFARPSAAQASKAKMVKGEGQDHSWTSPHKDACKKKKRALCQVHWVQLETRSASIHRPVDQATAKKEPRKRSSKAWKRGVALCPL